jgi:hypothetical protein
LWCADGHFFAVEKDANFLKYFFLGSKQGPGWETQIPPLRCGMTTKGFYGMTTGEVLRNENKGRYCGMTTKEGAGDAATKGRWGCRNKGALGNGNKREVLWNHNKGGTIWRNPFAL